ncbi:MAG: hypothetical protein ACLQUZ_05585 [Rhizomicrobium sp.]
MTEKRASSGATVPQFRAGSESGTGFVRHRPQVIAAQDEAFGFKLGDHFVLGSAID